MQSEVEATGPEFDHDVEAQGQEEDGTRELSEHEKRLRRGVARYREQARIARSEQEAACAAAVRERDAAVAAARDDARGRVMRAELKSAAVRAGIVDLEALAMADTSGVTTDEAGELHGVDDVIAALRERKPYLFGGGAPVAATTTAQLRKPPAPSQPVAVDARGLSREAWQVERDRLLSGMR